MKVIKRILLVLLILVGAGFATLWWNGPGSGDPVVQLYSDCVSTQVQTMVRQPLAEPINQLTEKVCSQQFMDACGNLSRAAACTEDLAAIKAKLASGYQPREQPSRMGEAYSSADSPYPVLDSGYGSSDQIVWVDNARVLFRGSPGPKPATIEEAQKIQPKLYLWDTRTNSVVFYSNGGNALCFHEGYIFYWDREPKEQRKSATLTWREGMFPNEPRIEIPQRGESDWGKTHRRNALTGCHEIEWPPKDVPDAWDSLLPEHGLLTVGQRATMPYLDNKSIYLVKPNGEKVLTDIELPVFSSLSWFGFKQAYLLYKRVGDVKVRAAWNAGQCMPYYWLYPTGKTEKDCLPLGPWSERASVLVDASIKGLLITSHAMESHYKAGVAGTYLLEAGKTTKLIDGMVEGIRVSPDGCKIAFAHMPDMEAGRIGGKGRRTLKMIDICTAAS